MTMADYILAALAALSAVALAGIITKKFLDNGD